MFHGRVADTNPTSHSDESRRRGGAGPQKRAAGVTAAAEKAGAAKVAEEARGVAAAKRAVPNAEARCAAPTGRWHHSIAKGSGCLACSLDVFFLHVFAPSKGLRH